MVAACVMRITFVGPRCRLEYRHRIRMEPIMAQLVEKNFIERANGVFLLSMLWIGLATCILVALFYDIAYWVRGW